jgi:hypothetical protein
MRSKPNVLLAFQKIRARSRTRAWLTGREAPGRTLERIEATIEPAVAATPERDGHE